MQAIDDASFPLSKKLDPKEARNGERARAASFRNDATANSNKKAMAACIMSKQKRAKGNK